MRGEKLKRMHFFRFYTQVTPRMPKRHFMQFPSLIHKMYVLTQKGAQNFQPFGLKK